MILLQYVNLARGIHVVAYKALYFAYFGSLGVLTPYLALYLKRIGLDGAEIGLLSTMRPIAALVGPLALIVLSSRLRHQAWTLPLLLVASLIPSLLFLGARSLWALALLYLLMHLGKAPVTPLLDDATLRTIDGKKSSYGPIRLWGSIGFIVGVYVVGSVAERFGIGASVVAHVLVLGCAAALAVAMARAGLFPDLAVGDGPARGGFVTPRAGMKLLWRIRDIRLALIAGVLARSAGLAYEVFFAIYADQLGMPERLIGTAWAIAVLSEVVLMAVTPKFADRLDARALFVLGIGAGVVRWTLCAATASPTLLLASQVLHGFTFGAFHVGAVTLLHARLPSERRTEGQSAWTVATSGLPGLVVLYPIGFLSDTLGMRLVFALSAILAGVGLLIALRISAKAVRESIPNERQSTESRSL